MQSLAKVFEGTWSVDEQFEPSEFEREAKKFDYFGRRP